ncbi:hypothetical protein LWI29_021832 [Acer saccharum]|uniref:AAA+ ATPase domain-containing protein n=1 Tax=Acer saccharum TaxID=4024 RepID=A0AA39SF93_ACESA|nr:hypothetical protein LWI29_021832 [Acer saccharum]
MVRGMFSGQWLLQMEKALQKHILGQSEAIGAVSRVIRRAAIGLIDTKGRPIGSFLFTGPIGVGKTLLAKSLALEIFGSKESIIKLEDMNKYNEERLVSKLTETLYNKSHSVILLDEIHRADSNVLKVILRVLHNGRLTDSNGLTVHFNNTIIIMTSTAGRRLFDKDSTFKEIEDDLEKTMQWELGEELFESIDEMIVFKQLGISELKGIAEIMIKEVCEKIIKTENIKVTVTENFKEKLANEAYGTKCQNRIICLSKVFRRLFVDNITTGILNGKVKEGAVTMDIDSLGNVYYFYPPCILVA